MEPDAPCQPLKIDGLKMDLEEDFPSVPFLSWHLECETSSLGLVTATQLQVRSIENAEKNPKEIDNWACSSGISMGVFSPFGISWPYEICHGCLAFATGGSSWPLRGRPW